MNDVSFVGVARGPSRVARDIELGAHIVYE